MGIGAYRHVVTVQAPGLRVPDGDGGFTESWTDADPPTWAVNLAPATAGDGETAIAGTVLPTMTHLARGRYHPGVTTQARLVFEGRVLNILTVRNLEERNRTLEVVCTEVGA
jgi:head-tail adaptor